MMMKSPRWIRQLSLLLLLGWQMALPADANQLSLVARTEVLLPAINYDQPTHQWLAQHPVLKAAIWGSSLPPIYMAENENSFEGLSADYLHMIERSLGVKIEVIHFDTSEQAMSAIELGEVDILAMYNPDLYPSEKVEASQSWLLDRSVLVLRRETNQFSPKALQGQSIGYVSDSVHLAALQHEYPGVELSEQPSAISAMGTVAWGQNAAAWLNRATADYLINFGFRNSLKLVDNPVLGNLNLSFGVRKDAPLLLKAIDTTLNRVPFASRLGIANRWELSIDNVTKANPLALTQEEQNWLRTHPLVDVLLNTSIAPVSFLDDEQQPSGAVVDLLNVISERYGIKFRYQTFRGRLAYVQATQRNPDALYATLPAAPNDNILSNSLLTRPYAVPPRVLVVNKSMPTLQNLGQLQGRKIAITQLNPTIAWLQEHYPQLQRVETVTVSEGINKLINGEVSGVITTQLDADYQQTLPGNKDIKIAMSVAGPAPQRMATNANNPLLHSIMDKALLDIPPETLHRIVERWQNEPETPIVTTWRDNKDLLIKISAGVVAIIALLLLWNNHVYRISRQRENARNELSDQLTFVQALIDAVPIAIYVLDMQGNLVRCNPAWRQAIGTHEADVMGKTITEAQLLESTVESRFLAAIELAKSSGEPVVYEGPLQLGEQVRYVHHWVVPWRDARGDISGIVGGWLDISEKEALVNQLRQAKEEADLANESKSVFLSSMSHEIRTPMNAIIGLLELEVKDNSARGEDNENVRIAWESAKSLLLLIGDILDLSKIESGTYQMRPARLDLPQLVRGVVSLFENRAREKGLTVTLNVDVQHQAFELDALMINQILSNLLSNAIKFTDDGEIEVSLGQVPGDDAEQAELLIEVTDSGPGLSEEQQAQIFSPFVQVGEGRKASMGTGLGLSISRRLAEMMGAELQVESEVDEGATFSLYFSAPICAAETQPIALPINDARPLHILIVDDHAPNRLLLSQQLEFLGHQVSVAEGGKQALMLWQQATTPVDLTITDCTMPEMDGFEFTHILRQYEQQAGKPPHPVLGLTALAEFSVVEKCLKAGMNDCIFKPVRAEVLHDVINRMTGRNAPVVESKAAPNPQALAFLLEEVVRTNRSDLAKMAQLLTEKNRPALIRLAHRIKGGANIIDAVELEAACYALESCGEAGEWEEQRFHTLALRIQQLIHEIEHTAIAQ